MKNKQTNKATKKNKRNESRIEIFAVEYMAFYFARYVRSYRKMLVRFAWPTTVIDTNPDRRLFIDRVDRSAVHVL